MSQFDNAKKTGQNAWNSLLKRGQKQPASVQEVGVTAAAGLGGAAILGATSKLGIAALLTHPAAAVTIGAVGGGVLGWRYIRNRLTENGEEVLSATIMEPETIVVATPSEA